jgi:hypothetical protein
MNINTLIYVEALGEHTSTSITSYSPYQSTYLLLWLTFLFIQYLVINNYSMVDIDCNLLDSVRINDAITIWRLSQIVLFNGAKALLVSIA